MAFNPQDVRRIFDKLVLLWELNPQWTVAQVVDNAHYAVEVEAGKTDLSRVENTTLEDGIDFLLEGSKYRGEGSDHC